MREKREKKGKKREGRKKNVLGQGGARVRCDFFSSPSSFPSDLQVESRERSQGKPRNK